MYGAKVVLNDVADMYAKARLEQTPIEASTWTKEESAPYPPAVRLTQAAMFAVGEWTGIGFYGLTVLLAALFLATSAWYFLQTRWYLFPLLYLNFSFFADRFVYVQDGSYLVMLTCVMGALVLTRRRHRRRSPADGGGDDDEAAAALLRAVHLADADDGRRGRTPSS